MEIWLDTSNLSVVQQATRLGILSGVTTNPSILSRANKDIEKILKDLLHFQEGPLAVQVVADEVDVMVQQAQNLFGLSNRIIIKVPITKKGLEVIHNLSRQGIPTMATVLFNSTQALLAAQAGADFIAPYLGQIEREGKDPWIMLKSMMTIFKNYGFKTKILIASIQNLDQVIKCAEIGVFAVTLKEELFSEWIKDYSLTVQRTDQFAAEWTGMEVPLFTNSYR